MKTSGSVISAQMTIDEALSYSEVIAKQNPPDPTIDLSQWTGQLKRVFQVMKNGNWMTLGEVSFHARAPEASVSARIRDLKKRGIPHEKRRQGSGLYEYRLVSVIQNTL